MGDYQWRTFTQMDSEAESFGRGLRELGLKAKDNVVLFAETRAEWLIAANGCMKQSMSLVTLYATLGEEAIIHGINETEVTCVITSQDLLPKFKNILPCTPNVTVLVRKYWKALLLSKKAVFLPTFVIIPLQIAMEDPLKPLDMRGYGDMVKILPYREVIRLGEMSSLTGVLPKPDDIAIIMYTSGSTGMLEDLLIHWCRTNHM